MRRSRKPIVIASRRSRLARIQAEQVGDALRGLHRDVPVEYRWIETEGDVFHMDTAEPTGGKARFTRAIERALLAGEADVGVHSLKDLPATDTPGLQIAAVPRRADVRDCLISGEGVATIESLPPGAVVGTSSPRRAAQLLMLRPELRIEPIRGNVETRLGKVLEASEPHRYDATLLAVAGLTRLGLTEHARRPIEPEQVLPASCQGALAVQCRTDDHVTLIRCLPLNNPTVSTAVHAERQVASGLGADCHAALAVLAAPAESSPDRAGDSVYRLRVRVMSQDGRHCLEVDESTVTKDLRRLVKRVVDDLRARGAESLLAQGPSPSTAVAAT